jgi:hypothetical protein
MEKAMRLKSRKRILFSALCAASTLSAAAALYSQATAQTWDSSQLPATNGTVRQYTLTPRGDVDGLILSDGTEVKVPPHLTGQIVYSIHPGDSVTIRGLRARGLPLVQAESITNSANGRTVVDNGPPGPAGAGLETSLSGRVSATLHGARGEVNGALLDNGIVLRLPPPEGDRMQALLQPGQIVAVRGARLDTALGSVIDVRAIGYSADRLSELPDAPPQPPGRGPRPGGPDAFPPPPAPGFAPPPPPPPLRG